MDFTEESELVERARRGDPGALAELLRSQESRVYHVCLRMVSHADDAAELAQDTLVKMMEHLAEFRGDAKLSTWATRIAMNLSISHLRKRKPRRTASLSQPNRSGQAAYGESIPGREPTPESCVEQKEMLDELQFAIAQLDDDQRAVLVLRDLEQLDYQTIADTLDLPVGTVKSRLFRARLSLREKLRPAPCPES
ncbi:MAG: sigma-70 family RNA polymerase sigma factor [Planctomycetota bacterium]